MTSQDNPYQPPRAVLTAGPDRGNNGNLDDALAGNYDFSIGTVLEEAWSLVHGSKMAFFLAGLAIFGIVLVASFVLSFLIPGARQPQPGFVSGILMQIVITVIVYPFFLGMVMLGLRRAAGQPIEVGQAFGYLHLMVPVAIAAVLVTVLTSVGFLLLLLPGIYLSVAYLFTLPLIADKNLEPWQAMETSRRAVTHHWFKVCAVTILPGVAIGFAFGFAGAVIAGAAATSFGGAAVLGMLIIFAAFAALLWIGPLIVISIGVLYRIIFGIEEQTLRGA